MNNKGIQILRTADGEAVRDTNNMGKTVVDGQPIYDKKNNWLYIANGDGTVSEKCPKTIHPNYAENCLEDLEVVSIWNGTYTEDSE